MTKTTEKAGKAEKTIRTPECPACSNKRGRSYRIGERTITGVYECAACGAVHGECYIGDSLGIVQDAWHDKPSRMEDLRHFDLTCLGSKGITRRHGWFDITTRRITQVG